jgi:pyrroline-5-carboxylate reductase
MTAVSYSDGLSEVEKAWVEKFLMSFGAVETIDEKLMDAVPAISGSSPAYMFQLIEAMADEGVRQGFQRDQAYRMAANAMYGAGKMVLETGLHPAVLKDQVTSPSGTTIEALKVLEENGFRASIMRAMEACTNKTKQLAGKK